MRSLSIFWLGGAKNKWIILYPFLIPVILCFQRAQIIVRQKGTLARYDYLLLAILLGWAFSLIIFMLTTLVEKDRNKQSLIFLIFSICIFYYYMIQQGVDIYFRKLLPSSKISSISYGYWYDVLFIICITLILFLIKKTKSNLHYLNKYLFYVIFFFLSIQIFFFIKRLYNKPKVELAAPPNLQIKLEKQNKLPNKDLPDVYYIICDAYSSSKSILKYSNTINELDSFLIEKGFYIATDSKSNYPVTYPSLASTLNMTFLNIHENVQLGYYGQNTLINSIRSSTVFNFFKLLKYKCVSLSHIFNNDQTVLIRDQPEILSYSTFYSKSLINVFLKNTIEKWALKRYSQAYNLSINNISSFSYYAYDNSVFNGLMKEAQKHDTTNKFVYAHFMATHAPYVLDSNGIYKNLYFFPPTPSDYLIQLKYLNKRLKQFVELVLKVKKNSIIIIQGDHGSHLFGVDEINDIQNNFYFPDKDYHALYPTISPVNSFRAVLNKYFNQNLPFLADKQHTVSY